MRGSILDALARGECIVADGAIGTQLQSRGLPPGTPPELWNLERPEEVRAVHQAYVEAGAQMVTTNTFGGNRVRLGEAGLADRLVELNRLGVEHARQAAGESAWVGGSIGPTGHVLEPFGDLSHRQAREAYVEQVRALAEAGVDLYLVETQHDAEEARLVVRVIREQTALPVFCTFAFDVHGRTMMGLRAADAARSAEEAGANVVGANCGDGPAAVAAALREMSEATRLPLEAKANAGIPRIAGGETVWDVTPEQLALEAQGFLDLGARVVGGCCGTGPEHVRAIVHVLHARGSASGGEWSGQRRDT